MNEGDLRILIFTPQLPPQHGGVGQTVYRLISRLSLTNEITVLMPEPQGEYPNRILEFYSVNYEKTEIVFLKSVKPNWLIKKIFGEDMDNISSYLINYRKSEIDDFLSKKKPDRIMIFDPLALAGLPRFIGYGRSLCTEYSNKNDVPIFVYYHSHYLGGIKYYNKTLQILFSNLVKKLTRKYLHEYKEIYLFSPYIKDELNSIGIHNVHEKTIEGLDLSRLKQFHKVNKNVDPTLIYFGRLMKEKNIKKMVGIVNSVSERIGKRINFVVIGDGPEEFRLKKLNKTINFTKIDWIDSSELFSLVRKANIFLNCSDFETLGLSMAEAMYLECVPVAYNKGGHIKLVNDKTDGFLCNTKEEYVEALIKLIRDPKLRMRMGKLARRAIEDHFDLDKNIKNLEVLLKI